jgi:hypothetical protein
VSSADLAQRLLGHLRTELREPTLEFAEPPAPIRGGYDTRIFAFRLTSGAPPPFSAPLILRVLGPQHPSAAIPRASRAKCSGHAGLPRPARARGQRRPGAARWRLPGHGCRADLCSRCVNGELPASSYGPSFGSTTSTWMRCGVPWTRRAPVTYRASMVCSPTWAAVSPTVRIHAPRPPDARHHPGRL